MITLRKCLNKKPLYVQAAEILREEILTRCQPGQKLASESKLAEQLGVSLLTLRHAVGALAQEGLVERRQGSGTYVTRPAHPKAVAVGTLTYLGQPANSFQMRLFLSVADLFRRQGYRCRSYLAPADVVGAWDELIEDLRADRIAGAVFVAMDPDTVPLPLAENNVPYLRRRSAGSVEFDDVDLVRLGVAHLVERGCRRLGLMQWTGNRLHAETTYEAFRSALSERGVPVREEWIHRMVAPEVPGAGWEQFREIWSARAEKPDGLLVTDDILFQDAAVAILSSKINVPEQLQVVTHANTGSGQSYPFPVSLLEVDLNEWAEAMVDRLIELMNHAPVSPAIQYIRARLIPPAAHRSAAADCTTWQSAR